MASTNNIPVESWLTSLEWPQGIWPTSSICLDNVIGHFWGSKNKPSHLRNFLLPPWKRNPRYIWYSRYSSRISSLFCPKCISFLGRFACLESWDLKRWDNTGLAWSFYVMCAELVFGPWTQAFKSRSIPTNGLRTWKEMNIMNWIERVGFQAFKFTLPFLRNRKNLKVTQHQNAWFSGLLKHFIPIRKSFSP